MLRKNICAGRPLRTIFVQISFRLVKNIHNTGERGGEEKWWRIRPVHGHCKFEFKKLKIAGDISDVSLTSLEIE